MSISEECINCDQNIRRHPELIQNLSREQQADVAMMLCGDCPIESGPWGGEELKTVTVYDLPDMPPITCPLSGKVFSKEFTHAELRNILQCGDRPNDWSIGADSSTVRLSMYCHNYDCPVEDCSGYLTMHYHLTQVQPQDQTPDIDLLEDLGMVKHVRLSGAALESHLKGKNPHKLYFPA